jgi:hypothetical protein
MLGHQDVADDVESVAAAGFLQRLLEDAFRFFRLKIGLTTITTEGDKVKVVGLLKSDESLGHGWRLRLQSECVCDGRHPALCWVSREDPHKQNRLVWGVTGPRRQEVVAPVG